MCCVKVYVLFFAFGVSAMSEATLNDYLSSQLESFEVLDPVKIISKRGLSDDAHRHLHFKAFNRSFHLVLRQAYTGTVSKRLTMQVLRDTVLQPYDASALFSDFYSGYIADEPNSRVHGYFADGHFHLTIDTRGDVLIFEPLLHLVGNRPETRVLVYYDSHMKSSGAHFCGLSGAGNVSQLRPSQPPLPTRPHRQRQRRATDLPLSRVCRLQLVADHTFVNNVSLGSVDSTGKALIKIADDINFIYQGTRFEHPETREVFTGIGFELAKIVVLPFPEKDPSLSPIHFNAPTADPSYQHTASHYLEAFGDFEQNQLELNSYCLNHLVTARPMQQNILGLAYLGSPYTSFIGGICSPPSMSTYERQRMIARNIGMTTYANKDGIPIVSRQALLVSAHELGHNMGSEHDPVQTGICSPAWHDGGPYLMYQIAVMGNAEHHSRFSECSSKQIAVVIKARQQNCFHDPRNTFCGNRRREAGEDCDAGPQGDDCCDAKCRLNPGKRCSDANSPCCDRCKLAAPGVKCQSWSPLHPCLNDTFCTGGSEACPAAANLANGTPCQSRVGTCVSGVCQSVCSQLGQLPCSCQAPAESCLVCCQPANNLSACAVYRTPLTGATVSLPANQPCAFGRCVANGTCQQLEIGRSQLIVRLWDLIVQSGSNSAATFLWKNIVFSVILVSLLLWVPACLIIAHQDRQDWLAAINIPSDSGGPIA